MGKNDIANDLSQLRSRLRVNKLTLELFLNDQIFHTDSGLAGIYICTYIKDPRYVYIGRTNDFIRRWKEHERDLISSIHCGKFQIFYNEHNCQLEDFVWNVLDRMQNIPEQIAAQERFRIQQYCNDGYHILLNSITYGGRNNAQ